MQFYEGGMALPVLVLCHFKEKKKKEKGMWMH